MTDDKKQFLGIVDNAPSDRVSSVKKYTTNIEESPDCEKREIQGCRWRIRLGKFRSEEYCHNEFINEDGLCVEHAKINCVCCGRKAVKVCEFCSEPLCEDCSVCLDHGGQRLEPAEVILRQIANAFDVIPEKNKIVIIRDILNWIDQYFDSLPKGVKRPL